MRTINLTIEQQTLTLNSLESLPVQGSDNSVKLAFAFDESWNNYPTRRAYFQYHFSNWKYVELSADNEVLVPREFLAKPGFKVMIRGYAQSGAIMATNIENVPVEFAPSLADSTAVVPVAIRSGDDAIAVEQEGDVVTISLNDEFESNKFISDYTIRGTAQGEIIFLDGVLLGTTEKSFADFKSVYNQIVIPYEFTIGATTYHNTLVATETRYNDQNAYYIADLLPLGQNYTAIVTIYLDENSVKAVIACLPFTLNNSFDNAPTSGSTKLVNSGAVYSALENVKALLRAYSDANLATAKSYADDLLVEGKQYTDTKYNSLVGIITHETEVMEARITQAITQMQNQVNASITGMETTIQGELTALDQRVDEAISTMNTTISSSLTNMESTIQQELANLDTRFSTLQTALEARITTLSNQIDSQFSTLQTQLEGRVNAKLAEADERIAELEDYQEELDNKADVDGNYPTLTSGLSLLTKNVEAKTKIEDNEPYAVRVVPSGVAEDCLVNGVVGVDVVKNQLIPTSAMHVTYTLTEDKETGGWGSQIASIQSEIIQPKIGHIVFAYIKTTDPTKATICYGQNLAQFVNGVIGSGVQGYGIYTLTQSYVSATFAISLYWRYFAGATAGTYEADIFFIDLTQRYGSNEVVNAIIGSDTSTQVAKLLAFDPDILKNTEYDTGTLINVQVNGRKVTNANIWDEEWEVGSISYDNGDNVQFSNRIRSKNYIEVIPNETFFQNYNTTGRQIQVFYYDTNHNFLGYENSFTQALNGLFTTPSNCRYIRFIVATDYGTTYKKDITINPSSPLINGTYISHKENTYPIQPIDLHGIFKVENGKVVANGDYYPYTGQGKRRYGFKANLGDLTYYKEVSTYTDTGDPVEVFYALIGDNKRAESNAQNLLCSKYEYSGRTQWTVGKAQCRFGGSSPYINIYDPAFQGKTQEEVKALMANVSLTYELATETDFEATPFTQIQKSYLDGTEEWLSPTNHINPPIPHETNYLPDLADKLELSPNNPNADGTYVVTRANGVNTYTSLGSWLGNNGFVKPTEISGFDSSKTQTLKNVNGTLTWVDDE